MAPSRAKLEPWIETMIINHGTDREKTTGNLKARVTAVGKMPNSQALGVQAPPELLFLSDGVVQIPAILTHTAWEHLQEEEERECFSSLVNTTVCLQTYSLQFQMAPEKRKSRFFLSLSNLAATAAGPIKESPPCCTTLPSVRVKICDTWKALQHQNVSQTESSGIDLTQLLGVWQYDCLLDLVEEVQERLTAARRTTSPPRPSTSRDPPALPLGTRVRTEWDLDRVRCKGAETFSVPMAHLVIPDAVALSLRPPTQPDEGCTQQSGLIPHSEDPLVLHSTPAAKPRPSTRRPSAEPQGVVRGRGFEKTTPPRRANFQDVCQSVLLEEVDADQSNPWNMFPPPSKVFCTSSSSETSPTPKPSPSQARPDPAAPLQAWCEKRAPTGTRASRVGPGVYVSPTLEPSKGDQSLITPYQMPASPHCSTSSTPDLVALAEPSAMIQSSGEKTPGPVSDHHHHHHPPGAAAVPEQGGVPCVDLSPPSWLFESKPGPVPEARRSAQQDRGAGGSAYPPVVHTDGSSFSYHYKVSLENVMDVSRFRVADDHLNWAVKYLVVPRHVADSNNV